MHPAETIFSEPMLQELSHQARKDIEQIQAVKGIGADVIRLVPASQKTAEKAPETARLLLCPAEKTGKTSCRLLLCHPAPQKAAKKASQTA